MDETTATAAETALPATGGEAPATQQVTQADPTQAQPAAPTAAGGDTPEQRGPVPYDRFQQVIAERNRYEEQLGRYAGLDESTLDLVRGLQALGYTREQVVGALQGPQQSPAAQLTPEQQFHAHLEAQGYDLGMMTDEQYGLLKDRWELQQEINSFRTERQKAAEEREQAEIQQQQAAIAQELNQVKQAHPVFQDPLFHDVLLAGYSYAAQHGVTLTQFAGQLNTRIEQLVQDRIGQYATAKQQDAQVPVVAGGSAPPPTPAPQDPLDFTREGRRNMVAQLLRAQNQANAAV